MGSIKEGNDLKKTGMATAPDYVCIRFSRAPESLIEEPEICENCAHWSGGVCGRDTGDGSGEGGSE